MKYNLSIIVPIYQRYDLTLASLMSLYQMSNKKSIKFILIDDNSLDLRLYDRMIEFKEAVDNKSNFVVLARHSKTYGMLQFWKTLYEGIEFSSDCEYTMLTANDLLYNPYLIDVVIESTKMFKVDNVKCISFWQDHRRKYKDRYKDKGEFNKYFNVSGFVDGFLTLFQTDFMSKLKWEVQTDPNIDTSGVWQNINKQLEPYTILEYTESLAEHIGNIKSSMHIEQRSKEPLYSENTNLFKKPRIL